MLFSVFLYLFSRFSFISYVQFSSSRTGHQLLSIKVKKLFGGRMSVPDSFLIHFRFETYCIPFPWRASYSHVARSTSQSDFHSSM